MAVYKVTFTPSGPYFFGNEKNFSYNGSKYGSQYFIQSETMPAQSTVLGALRYILLPHKGFTDLSRSMQAENLAAIGEKSFSLDAGFVQHFGKIKALSAVFLAKGNESFIPTPFDHDRKHAVIKAAPTAEAPDRTRTFYTPFQSYQPLGEDPVKLYTEAYDAKEGLTDSFMSLSDGHLETDLFGSDVRIGINRLALEDGFFKREYRCLQRGFAFAVYAELDREDLAQTGPYTVKLGQDNIPFAVNFIKTAEPDVHAIDRLTKEFLQESPRAHKTLYCLSDMLTGDTELYANTRFAIVRTRDYRSYSTEATGGVTKGTVLHRLVKAGSVFLLKDEAAALFADEERHKNAATAGYNQAVIIGGTET